MAGETLVGHGQQPACGTDRRGLIIVKFHGDVEGEDFR